MMSFMPSTRAFTAMWSVCVFTKQSLRPDCHNHAFESFHLLIPF